MGEVVGAVMPQWRGVRERLFPGWLRRGGPRVPKQRYPIKGGLIDYRMRSVMRAQLKIKPRPLW
jgi:hypothetical protein